VHHNVTASVYVEIRARAVDRGIMVRLLSERAKNVRLEAVETGSGAQCASYSNRKAAGA
jgi:hypothetical protein